LAVTLAACPGPGTPDAGTGGSSGGGTGNLGSCDDAGTCPGEEYCEPFITQCSGQDGVGVQLQPGVCYADFPCAGSSVAAGDCSGSSCGGDDDCGESDTDTGVGLVCQAGVCALPGSSSGGTGGGEVCPTAPSPCPAGCSPLTPVHGCPVCLCSDCPSDTGGNDGGNPDGGTGCPTSSILCAGVCSNPLTDHQNCGGCGNLCAPIQFCEEGFCMDTDGGTPDSGVSDAGTPDAGTPDGGPTDGGLSDGGPTDGGLSDGGLTDGRPSDGGPGR
jgi:hypothetical protein